jgi:acyl carrier protein
VISTFERELIEAICHTCNVQDVEIDTIQSDDPLIGPESPLGIDSLDALEIVVMVQKTYGVRIDSQNTSRMVLQTVATLADYIQNHSVKQP